MAMVQAVITEELLKKLDTKAAQEKRSRSNMIELILSKALKGEK